ncbi:MAG: hypothetical protein OXI52_07060 [Caldilineaceae bacterium]|nr:hypothetical protein [Caldilineaceae bacterium]MCY3994432.1 hypothetical protein [Caldilineaceae bacterium]MDE0079461.1 hypothetical protein [Caldilineaceae bacterium]MDE0312008.1 hypothetical protein [Caldilineaceae bacterium]
MRTTVTLDLPDDVYRRLLRSAEFNERALTEEIAHLIMRQFDRNYSKAEFDKLVREILQGYEEN